MEMICVAECTAINKKSKAEGFATLEIGDVVTFTASIESSGRSRNGTYATYIYIKNNRTGEDGWQSFNQIGRLLNNYEFKQLNTDEL